MTEKKRFDILKLDNQLCFDSGTLMPVLKTLEKRGYLTRTGSKEDERVLNVEITAAGMELRNRAIDVPEKIASCVQLSIEEVTALYTLLRKLMKQFEEE